MQQQATRAREARLGKAIGPAPGAVGGVALLLPAGEERSTRRPSPLAAGALRPLARGLTRAGRTEGLVTHTVRYRGRGWNGAQAELARDARWAADEVVRRYGDVPVCLVGVDMGGRAALHAADHPAVNSVLALAPWLPEDDVAVSPEPVHQLAGRRVLIVHGTDDRRTDPELSFRLAGRAKKTVVVEVQRRYRDPVYGKYVKSRKKYHAHDEQETYRKNDVVEIEESRPLSATKRWVVIRLVTRPEEV